VSSVEAATRGTELPALKLRPVLLQIVLIGTTVLMLYPIVVMVFSAFKSTGDIYDQPFAVPDFGNLANFVKIITQTNFLVYLSNSVIVTGGAILSILVLGGMAAYGLPDCLRITIGTRQDMWASAAALEEFLT